MKNIIVYATVLLTVYTSCQDMQTRQGNNRSGENSESEKKISSRDMSINQSNAYSDLFLDSMDMENFIIRKKLDDSVARRMRSFYNTRNYQFAWFSSDGLTEQALGFWNLLDYATTYNDSLLPNKALQKKMDNLITEEDLSVSASDKSFINTELTLTQHLIEYILNNYERGLVKRKEMERFIPIKKEDVMAFADSLINKKHKDDKYFEDVNEPYRLLKDQVVKYFKIAKQGGWPQITISKKILKKGITAPEIITIKKRLEITGEMIGTDTSHFFNDTFENGIKTFQLSHGYKPNGIITSDLVKEMNVPVEKRLEQILMNMGRMRWVPNESQGNLIVVNIPEFILHVYEGKNEVFNMEVVVGKEGHNTMMFSGDLNQIVFSPYWNVPPSIVKKEILPEIEKNPNYLESQKMEITGNEDGLPVIRQLPGPKNSLGKVKFLFPNSFNIYFHDTPAKSLFYKDKRAFSHGCIRLSEPKRMAEYLLRNKPEWTLQKINDAMNSGEQKFVKIKKAVPVMITYYTAWVDQSGQLNFREDIYEHDARLAKKMFTNGILGQ